MPGLYSKQQDLSRWTKLVVPDTSLGVGLAFSSFITNNNTSKPPVKGHTLVEKKKISDIIDEIKNDPKAVGIVPYIPLNGDLGTK